MRRAGGRRRFAIALLGLIALIALCSVQLGCGGSNSGADSAAQPVHPEEEREAQENRQVRQELKDGDFVDCGGHVYVNRKTFCAYAKNMQSAYYVEVVSGSGKPLGFYPRGGKDFRVFCSGTVPH